MSTYLFRAGVFGAIALAGLVSGCSNASLEQGAGSGEALGSSGTLELPLTATSAGVKYRLNKAKFGIASADGKTKRTITPPADLPVDQETLPAGDYQIALAEGWVLEAKGPDDSSFAAVKASLTSPNPQKFTVSRGRTVDVVFTFLTPGVAVSLSNGRANVRISVDDCASYNSVMASIATFTVDCLGRIDPNSYLITDDGHLKRNFDECPLDKSKLQSIDDFLGLQYGPDYRENIPPAAAAALSVAKECMADRYAAWRDAFDATGITQCPDWRKVGESNTPNNDLYSSLVKQLPTLPYLENGQRPDKVLSTVRVDSVYAVAFPAGTADRACQTPADCAAQCAGGFPGFVLGQDGDTIFTDPPSWQRDTSYTDTTTDPYERPGYYHPMSLYGALPGEIFSHINRADAPNPPGEWCSYWDGTYHIKIPLRRDCSRMPDGTDSCVGICAP